MSIGQNDCIRIWGAAESIVGEIRGHVSETRDVVFSADGLFLVHTDVDGTTKIWKTETQEPVYDSGTSRVSGCALMVLQNCEPKSSYLWPRRNFSDFWANSAGAVLAGTGNIFPHLDASAAGRVVYCKTPIGFLHSGSGISSSRWECTFVTVVRGGLVICRLAK